MRIKMLDSKNNICCHHFVQRLIPCDIEGTYAALWIGAGVPV